MIQQGFSYIIRIEIATQSLSLIVRNDKKVPQSILEEIARVRIKKQINDTYAQLKHYRVQTIEQFFEKQIKQSNYEIEDLNECEVYDLQIEFENETIKNELKQSQHVETKQSRINKAENDYNVSND